MPAVSHGDGAGRARSGAGPRVGDPAPAALHLLQQDVQARFVRSAAPAHRVPRLITS